MKAALDGTPLSVVTGGVRRYTEELIEALRERYSGVHEFTLLSDQLERPSSWLARRWWLYGLPRELNRRKVDVFHGTDFSVPYWRACATVMTIHDLSPWKDPRWHVGADRIRRRTPWQLRAGLATMVITPSEAIRREVTRVFQMPPGRVRAIPLAAAGRFHPVPPLSWHRPYFLCLGTLEPRKNLPFLIKAWRAADVPADLLLCGRQREDFVRPPAEQGLHILGAVPDAELPALYSGAIAVLYPSLYEGFGLPVLEAMQCGAAVAVSTDAALRETTGDAALAACSSDQAGWVRLLRELYNHRELRDRLRTASLQRAALFSWRRTAEETMAVYEEARNRFAR